MNLFSLTALEWAATGATALSVALAARRHLWTWPLGILGCVLFGALFFTSRLYADALLQVFFIVTSGIGWREWIKSGLASDGPSNATRLRSLSPAVLTALGVAVTASYGVMLKHWTDAYAPFWDSAVMASSVVAQILLMQGRWQTWPVWLLVNSLSVPLYLSRELHITAVLYTFFWINAWYGWWHWRRLDARRR